MNVLFYNYNMRHVCFIFDKNKEENEHEKKRHLSISISNEDYYMALWHEIEKSMIRLYTRK